MFSGQMCEDGTALGTWIALAVDGIVSGCHEWRNGRHRSYGRGASSFECRAVLAAQSLEALRCPAIEPVVAA